jgi:hypothetical protein
MNNTDSIIYGLSYSVNNIGNSEVDEDEKQKIKC